MAGATVNLGTGTTITFATTGFNAEVTDVVRWGSISRPAVDTTHLATTQPSGAQIGGRTFIPGKLADPGEIVLTVHHNPQLNPPVNSAAETITVTFPLVSGDATAAYWSGTGFVTAVDLSVPLEDKMSAQLTLKMSGVITFTDAT